MRDFFANTLDLLAGGGAAIAGFLHGMTNGQGRTAILLAAGKPPTADYPVRRAGRGFCARRSFCWS